MLNFLLFLFLGSSLHALCLKGLLRDAQEGDYLVLEQERMLTLFHTHSKNDCTIIFEEVSLSEKNFLRLQEMGSFSWKEWLGHFAPRHSSWIMHEVDLVSGKVVHSYSFDKKCWLASQEQHFLPTLLNLAFEKIPPEERRRAGQAPRQGERDRRPIWNPPMIVEGKQFPHVSFDAWRARWPKDGSPLSEALIDIYLPTDSLSYFPYWLQLSDSLFSAKLRVIDSGKKAHSPYTFNAS